MFLLFSLFQCSIILFFFLLLIIFLILFISNNSHCIVFSNAINFFFIVLLCLLYFFKILFRFFLSKITWFFYICLVFKKINIYLSMCFSSLFFFLICFLHCFIRQCCELISGSFFVFMYSMFFVRQSVFACILWDFFDLFLFCYSCIYLLYFGAKVCILLASCLLYKSLTFLLIDFSLRLSVH